ncbi:hypothetical protein MPER_11806, partial [Moniliophthora perniciosa FA553]
MAIIDADPYIPGGGGAQWFTNQNNFFRVDPGRSQGTGIHWQVAQATSLQNIVFELSRDPNTAHQGIWMENGSGGFMGDLVFNGGKFGMWVGNQQFTVRNITVNNANTAVNDIYLHPLPLTDAFGRYSHCGIGLLPLGWTFQDIKINNCQVGFDITTGGLTQETQSVGAEARISSSEGARGDGRTDDTSALQAIFDKVQFVSYSGCKIIFFDHGTYVVTNTLTIPAGTQIVGEAWSTIAGRGSAFTDYNNPRPVVRVGAPNSQGILEISDMIFTTIGPTAGAIVVEWNVKQPSGNNGGAGMWDSHIRLGG